jgi:hypothetical protein
MGSKGTPLFTNLFIYSYISVTTSDTMNDSIAGDDPFRNPNVSLS